MGSPARSARWRVAAVVAAAAVVFGGGALYAAPSSPATASAFHPLASTRVLDTRLGIGEPVGPVGGGATLDLIIPGLPDDATAVAVNVTVTDGTASSFLTLYPMGDDRPDTSAINWASAAPIANSSVVTVHNDHRLRVFNAAGSVQVLMDLVGYYAPLPSGTGVPGPTGPIGPAGPPGSVGAAGPAGSALPLTFSYVFHIGPETVPIGGRVSFDGTTGGGGQGRGNGMSPVITSLQADSFVAGTTGVYKLSFAIQTTAASQFEVLVNGAAPGLTRLVFGSPSGTNSATTFVSVTAGDVVSVTNATGTVPAVLSTGVGGSAPGVNAWIEFELVDDQPLV